jgi:hypothetical protein
MDIDKMFEVEMVDEDDLKARLRYLELAVMVLLDSYKATMGEFKEHRTAIEYLLAKPSESVH